MGVVIRRWVWLETIGVVSGCFPHITYISLLHLYLFFFAAASLLLFSFFIHRMTSHYTYIHNNQYISRAYIYQYIHYQIHYVQYTTYCIYIVICGLE